MHSDGAFDTVIVGGGIAGNALAIVLARSGREVLVLERASSYQDRVRGEYLQPWGVAEARRLGIHDVLMGAGGVHHTRFVPYDETSEPAEAEAAAMALDQLLPHVPGTLGVGHPHACEALAQAAAVAGARVLRGVEIVDVELGRTPGVQYRLAGRLHVARCRLVIGADGRQSTIRRRAGISLQAAEPTLLGSGLLVEDVAAWPDYQVTIGVEDDRIFFVLPQAHGRVRLYLMYPAQQRHRFAGPGGPRAFLDSFRLACMPTGEAIAQSRPAGPCATYPMQDTWTDLPLAEGVALIGDAAGYSDPHLGQGLSLALRDVRDLSELLLAGEDWSPKALRPYAASRAERLRRLRFCNAMNVALRAGFNAEGRALRRRARARMQAEPDLALWRRAVLAGPDAVPASAFDEQIRDRLLAPVTVAGR